MLRALATEADVTLASLVHDAAEAAEAGRLAPFTTETIVAPVPHFQNRLRALARSRIVAAADQRTAVLAGAAARL